MELGKHIIEHEALGVSETFVPYVGATQDVDLGSNALWTGTLNMNETGQITFFNATAILETAAGKIALQGGFNAELDVNGITADRTFAFPDNSGTIALNNDAIAYAIALG